MSNGLWVFSFIFGFVGFFFTLCFYFQFIHRTYLFIIQNQFQEVRSPALGCNHAKKKDPKKIKLNPHVLTVEHKNLHPYTLHLIKWWEEIPATMLASLFTVTKNLEG